MVKEWTRRMVIVFIFLSILTLFFIGTLKRTSLTGFIASEGGNVTMVNIEGAPINHWRGIYGDLGTGLLDSIDLSVSDPEVINLDLNLPKCYETEVYATRALSIYWASVEPALPSDVDNYIGLDSSHPLSATNVFTTMEDFNVSGQTLSLYSARTNSYEGDYLIGILKQAGILIFITKPIMDGISFDYRDTDYQMMLPLPFSGSETYHFFEDPWDAEICGATVVDNNLPVLSLTNVEGYLNTPLQETFYVTDADDDRVELRLQPDLLFLNLDFSYDQSMGRYQGIIDFIPRQKGTYFTNFILNDGKSSKSHRIEFDIGWCGNFDRGGDPKCEREYEDCENCPQDCGACSDRGDSMVMIPSGEVCKGKDFEVYAYERYKTDKCSEKKILNGIEVCDPVVNANIGLYVLETADYSHLERLIERYDDKVFRDADISDDTIIYRDNISKADGVWILIDEFVTDNSGAITLRLDDLKNYKLKAERSGYYPTYLYIDPKVCIELNDTQIPEITGKMVENVTKNPDVESPESIPAVWRPTTIQLIVFYSSLLITLILIIRYIRKR